MITRIFLFSALFCFLFPVIALSHVPALSVDDNEDGTIDIEVGFSDGGSGAGHKIILKEEESGNVIAQYTVPQESALTVKKPEVPYTITFDAGVGHRVTRKGPAIIAATAVQEQSEQPAALDDLLTLASEMMEKIETIQKQRDQIARQLEIQEIQKAALEKQIREYLSELDAILQKVGDLRGLKARSL